MTIRYFADIRDVTGREDQEWTAPVPTLRALLAELCHAHGRPLAQRLFYAGELSRTITILVNGRNVVHLGGLDAPLRDDDVVAIFPMVAGG